MSCGKSGRKKHTYTGNQVGPLNFVGPFNFVAGGPPGSGLSAGTTVEQFIPKSTNRSPWLRADAKFDEKLLDACYPTIDLQWFADIELMPDVIFRVSDRSFHVQDDDGTAHYYDARCDKAPSINATVGEWLAPKYQISDLALSLNNRDGFFNRYLPLGEDYQQWTNAKVNVYIGFGEKRSNYLSIFQGTVAVSNGLTTTRDTVELKVNDKLEADQIPLPPRVFSSDNFPDVTDDLAGKMVPLVYGDWSETVPEYGSVPAYCTNALEDGAELYLFKISDIALESIDSVWLHRGDRAAGKPEGPIRIADNILQLNPDAGEFTIPSSGVVLDEPYYIGQNLKAGVGTSGAIIAADNNYNFLLNGVKPGDKVVNGAPTNAGLTIENLHFKSTETGAGGNVVQIEYYLKAPNTDALQSRQPTADLVGNIVRVGIARYYDHNGAIIIGTHTAASIKSAISANPACNALVRVSETGSVPSGYPAGTKVGKVNQTVPLAPVSLNGGQDPTYYSTILSVSNFQITVDGLTTFTEGQDYTISTVQYKFLKGDKFTVVCQGKPLNLVSVDRLPDISRDITQPESIRVTPDATMWVSDNATQKIYNLSFSREILRTINFTDIDPSITKISGIEITTDDKLWCTDPTTSTVFRYDLTTNELGFALYTGDITGISTPLANVTGIAVEANNQFWLVDKATSEFYLVDAFAALNPFVVRHFNGNIFEVGATEILDVCVDNTAGALTCVDRTTNYFFRFDKVTGALISSLDLTTVAANMNFVTGLSVAQDGTLFFVDQSLLTIYNYNDMANASSNPAIISRDLLQKFGGHKYNDFDLSWMQTARQLSTYKTRYVFDKNTKMVDAINGLLRQFNTVFHLRFNRYALFFISFENFRTTGKTVKEKDIKDGSFRPGKETNQYFNSVTANFNNDPFAGATTTSDTYCSPAAISFAGKEVNKVVDMSQVYRRDDLDRLMPLLVKLSAPDPEFITVTFNFRQIRSQMHDFLNLIFDGDVNCKTGQKESGRHYNNVPCMIRSLKYDLDAMTVEMKLWSLGNTSFPGYEAQGRTVGGDKDPIVLSNIGRAGRVSPTAAIVSSDTNSVTVEDVDGIDAQHRTHSVAKLAWAVNYSVEVVDGLTKEVVQTLSIKQVIGNQIIFNEDLAQAITPTTKNAAGFVNGGHYLQYSTYERVTNPQRSIYASFTRPTVNYPTSKTQELEEQRGGVHNFDDGGVPYVLYPDLFTSY